LGARLLNPFHGGQAEDKDIIKVQTEGQIGDVPEKTNMDKVKVDWGG